MDKCTSSVKVRNPSVMLPFNSFTTLLSCHSSLKRISQKTGKFKKNYNKILQKCLILEEIAMMTSQTENLFHINAALKKKNQFQYWGGLWFSKMLYFWFLADLTYLLQTNPYILSPSLPTSPSTSPEVRATCGSVRKHFHREMWSLLHITGLRWLHQ